MSKLIEIMDEKFYSRYQDNWDDELFRNCILGKLDSSMRCLDLGAGAGIVPHMNFKGIVSEMCGVDPDPRVLSNPFLDEGRQGFGENIPYNEETFDAIFSDNVLEHLPKPLETFQEVARLLVPGGTFLAKTPNKTHYMPFVARLTPHKFHQWVNKWRGRYDRDVFPTLYKANTEREILMFAKASGLELVSIQYVEGRPEYLRFSPIAYLFGMAYERLVNSLSILMKVRILLIVELRKPKL